MKIRLIITTLTLLLLTTATAYATHITIDGDVVTGGQWTGANCYNDAEGADDISVQRDLTTACIDGTDHASGSINVYWAWDDIVFNGMNTGDACVLFDTDADGFANFALCASILGNPPTLNATRLFACPTDDSATNCGGFVIVPAFSSSCGVALNDVNPFDATLDTVAECNILISEIGGATAVVVDICSYPSASSPSAAADCLNIPPVGPTAVSFQSLTVHAPTAGLAIILTLIVILGVLSMTFVYRPRRRQN